MFIDINTYVGHWPFRNLQNNTLVGLDELAQKYGITHMVVANINGFFYKDANAANEELLAELKSYRGKTVFLPMAIVNPLYPEWEQDARRMIAEGFSGFELAPLYHGYDLKGQLQYGEFYTDFPADKVMALAEELDVPVRICARIEDIRGRGRMDIFTDLTGEDYYALLKKFPNVHVLCNSFAPARAGEKFAQLLKSRKNTYFDFIKCDSQSRLPEKNLEIASMEQLCYGSLSPFEYMEASLLDLMYSKDYDSEAIKSNGARAFRELR